MSAVDAAAIHSDRHLFAHGAVQPEEPPTVSPNEVVISSSYSPGTIHPSVLDEDAALHHDQDFEPLDLSHDPSIQPGESAATSIQVLDDVPDHIGPTIEDMGSSDDSQDWTEGDSQEHKRVKVYELVGSHWEDQGTAFCYGHFDEATNEAQLIARAETNLDKTILCTTIRSCDVYQRQQETLIVWTELDGVDYALSFQEAEGCAEVWNFIAEVQQHMKASEDHGFGPMSGTGPDTDLLAASKLRGSLPEPRMNSIPEIERIIKILSRATAVKEKMCEWMQREGYIISLIEVFTKSEDLESLNDLHALCRCMQTILLLNDHTIYEHILDDLIFMGVMGILEYDPEFPDHKANYREFLRQNTRFHAPIPIRDEAIERKVHHTYRLQFLKDVVLARVLDDSTFNVINSCILFNQMDIINHVQHDRFFLAYVVQPFLEEGVAGVRWWRERLKEFDENRARTEELMDVDGPPLQILSAIEDAGSKAELTANRRSIVLMLQQLCAMGKNVQLPTRLTLFRNLIDRAILFPVQWALTQDEGDEQGKQIIAAAGEILSVLLDHDINGVRGFVLRQMTEADGEQSNTLLSLMCRNMVRSRDLAVQSQIGDALRLMLEIPLNDPNDPAAQAPLAVKLMQRAKDDPGVEKFLEYFYKSCIDTLFKPFGDIPEFRQLQKTTLPMSKERTNLFLYLCDLLCNFALQHSFRSHFFLLSSNISTRIASLLSSRDKHLCLAAFRFFRICLRINNRNLFNHLMKLDILQPVIGLAVKESGRDNLISSSCQEFFDHMRKENIKELINHCMTKHEVQIRKLAETPLGGPRFSAFVRRWEMNVEPLPEIKEEPDTKPEKGLNGFRWGQGRGLNREEERYFSEDGPDEDDQPTPLISSPSITSSKVSGSALLKRKRSTGNSKAAGGSPQMALPRTLPIGNLVGYGGDDDDDDDEGGGDLFSGLPHPPKRRLSLSSEGENASGPPATPRLSHRRIGSQAQTFQPLPSPDDDDDEEDTLLESLVTGSTIKLSSTPSTPPAVKSTSSPTVSSPELGPMKMGEKRRRGSDDDDDDEWMLERLATKAKRISNAVGNCGENPEGGPKKIKLILNKLGSNLTTPSQMPPSGSDGG